MFKRSKGFTLIELLIVVAIIGILAALLIPNMMNAMQRAKQKGTMADISTMATYLMDYTTDRGIAPDFGGTEITSSSQLYSDLVPDYARVVPSSDQWGNLFIVFSGDSFSSNQWGLTSSSSDDFAIGSPGRDGSFTFTYVEADGPEFYVNDFEKDLVSWNGQFICRPATTAAEAPEVVE